MRKVLSGRVLALMLPLALGNLRCSSVSYSDRLETGFVELFNGSDLTGWEGDANIWKVENGMIVGRSPGVRMNRFLATTSSYEDFILKLSFRLVENVGNSGVQFRSKRLPGSTEVSGYQAEIEGLMTGSLYDESRRNRFLAKVLTAVAQEAIKKGEWNDYLIRCQGNHIVLELNGVKTADYQELDTTASRTGIIAFQVHEGVQMEVQFKNIRIKVLP